MYSITSYGGMIADRARVGAYADALRRVITTDSVVVDLGTGTGIFALLACRMGARLDHGRGHLRVDPRRV